MPVVAGAADEVGGVSQTTQQMMTSVKPETTLRKRLTQYFGDVSQLHKHIYEFYTSTD